MDLQIHTKFLEEALQRKNKLQPPAHSLFRVFAIITYILHKSSSNNNLSEEYVTGTNGETSFIGGSICAERAALMKLREMHVKIETPTNNNNDINNKWDAFGGIQIKTIYVVSDHPDPITPGLLCREFLLESATPDTLVVMSGDSPTSLKQPFIISLGQLLPFSPLFARVPTNRVTGIAQEFASHAETYFKQSSYF